MKKHAYKKPEMSVVRVQHQSLLANTYTGPVRNIEGGTFEYGGAGNGSARSRSFDDWDEE